jgi:serine/threonine protein kinase
LIRTVDFSSPHITRIMAPCGGSGATVYACEVQGMQCALKEFRFLESKKQLINQRRKKVLNEIEVLQKLSHPNIVRYLSHHTTHNSIQLFLTRYESTLRKEVSSRAKGFEEDLDDPFTCDEIRFVMSQVANGLAFLHQNLIIHRDLKTANLFLNYNMRGEIDNVVIADFDSAKILRSDPKSFCGTNNYIAPEVIQLLNGMNEGETKVYSVLADIWSFGVVLYEMIGLQIPYANDTPQVVIQSISQGIRPTLLPNDKHLTSEYLNSCASLITLYKSCTVYDAQLRPTSCQLVTELEN